MQPLSVANHTKMIMTNLTKGNLMKSILNVFLTIFCLLIVVGSASGQLATASQAYQLSHSIVDNPTPSPDGKRLLYMMAILGKEQFFIMNVDGTGSVQITRDDADHEDPAWSPDGKSIAFVYIRDGLETISTMNIDGTGMQMLTPKNVKGIHPNWSPDGSKLAYCTDDDLAPPRKNDSDIIVIDMGTRHATTLITGGVNTYPAWSPDGKQIAFRRMKGETNSEVFVANADGTNALNITNNPAFDGWPAWSPDGARIAFASNRRSSYQIFTMKPDGTDVRLLANTEGRGTAPQWGRDGLRIYFPICKNVDFGVDCQIFVARTQGFVK